MENITVSPLELAEQIIAGRRLQRTDDLDFLIRCDLNELCRGADKIRAACVGSKVNLCSITYKRSWEQIILSITTKMH